MSVGFYNDEESFFAELAASKAGGRTRVKNVPVVRNDGEPASLGEEQEGEGQLTVDVFQDEDSIFVQSAIAGITPEDLNITITKESVSIKGRREKTREVEEENYFYQECFWGGFSRSIVLPQEVDPDDSSASFKNGILTIKMPKLSRKKTKNLKVKTDE